MKPAGGCVVLMGVAMALTTHRDLGRGNLRLVLISLACLGAGVLRVEQRDIELPASGRGLLAGLLPTTQRRT